MGIMGEMGQIILEFWNSTGLANFSYQSGIMIVVALLFLYLAIRHGFEPLLLVRLHSECFYQTFR